MNHAALKGSGSSSGTLQRSGCSSATAAGAEAKVARRPGATSDHGLADKLRQRHQSPRGKMQQALQAGVPPQSLVGMSGLQFREFHEKKKCSYVLYHIDAELPDQQLAVQPGPSIRVPNCMLWKSSLSNAA